MEKNIKAMLLACLLLASQTVNSQKVEHEIERKNLIKINLSSFVFQNTSLQYERVIRRNISVALGVSLMPRSPLPFAGTLQDEYGHNADAKRAIETTKLGNFSLTPELRWYLGKKGAPHGFYVAPYVRYNQLSFEQLYEFSTNDNRVYHPLIKGTIRNIGGGLLLGAQWGLGKRIYLDWWIAGAVIGVTNGTFVGFDDITTMTTAERVKLKKDIEGVPIPLSTIHATVSDDRVDATLTGPYIGVRAFGIVLGFKL